VARGEIAHFEKFEHVISDIIIGESRVEDFEVDIVDVFRDQAWDLGSRIANHVQQGHDIWTSSQVLENFDFPFDLLLLDGFEDFDDTLLVVDDMNTFEDLFDGNVGTKTCTWVMRSLRVVLTSEYFPRPTFRTIS